ncbi:MAG TPA: ABC transporter substrate-binding protein [Methylomirabilota bacterium]|nr:ABC transporter substrate-binding protein [Methylomirabilota bacterium]
MTWGVHVSLTPAFFDPAEATGTALPLMVYYAIHDALVRPLPGQRMGAALAQSWEASRDGLTYDFTLRKGVRFQNGDPVTAEDVKFSFERYRGASASLLKAKVASVEILGPQRVRFRLKQPWPDFMTFYATPATGAAWIVPKKYVEKVGDEAYKKAPVGAGRTGWCPSSREWSWCWRPSMATGGRSPASRRLSSRSCRTMPRGWPPSSAAR